LFLCAKERSETGGDTVWSTIGRRCRFRPVFAGLVPFAESTNVRIDDRLPIFGVVDHRIRFLIPHTINSTKQYLAFSPADTDPSGGSASSDSWVWKTGSRVGRGRMSIR